MKVLVSAYACEPEKGSEPGVGWNWARQIGRYHQVWVLTRSNNREPIELALEQEPLANVHFVYFDLPRWMRFWKKKRRGARAYYYIWQIGAYFVAQRLHRQIGFDLVHHVTFVNYWMPSFLALLPVPFVWGPVGGGDSAPRSFFSSFGMRGKIYEILRDLARSFGHLDPFVRLTARRAAVVLSATPATEKRLRALGCRKIFSFPEPGLPGDEIRRLSSIPPRRGNPFRVASIGNLLHFRGFALGLKAFAQFHSKCPASEYWIIGAGPERRRLECLARELGVAERVTFRGYLPRAVVLEKLTDCDVLLHPSLHESGSWVCLEAMAAGRPVICLDLGGPAVRVTEETGIKAPAISPEQVVRDLATALGQLANNPELRARLGQAAYRRVEEHFNWEKRSEILMGMYRKVAEGACE